MEKLEKKAKEGELGVGNMVVADWRPCPKASPFNFHKPINRGNSKRIMNMFNVTMSHTRLMGLKGTRPIRISGITTILHNLNCSLPNIYNKEYVHVIQKDRKIIKHRCKMVLFKSLCACNVYIRTSQIHNTVNSKIYGFDGIHCRPWKPSILQF